MLSGLFSKWKSILTQFVEDRVRMVQLEFIDRTSSVLGYLLFIIASLFLGFTFLILLGLGIAEVFSHMFDSSIAGYFCAAGVFLLFTILLVAFHKPFSERIANIFVRILTSQKDDESDKG